MSDEHASGSEADQNGTGNGASVNGDASAGAGTDHQSEPAGGADVHNRKTIADPEAGLDLESEPEAAAGADGEESADDESATPEPTPLEKAVNERDRMKDQLLRIAADFDNFRKRSRREIEDARRRSQQDTILDILPVIDNLERAAQASESTDDVQAVADGVKMVLRGFEDVASRLGISRIDVVGERFDPNLHDAMQQQETDEHEPGTIVAEIVPGYTMGDRLLRPAMVVVAKPPTSSSEAPVTAESSPPADSTPPTDSPTENGDDVVFIDDEDDGESNGADSSAPSEAPDANSAPPKEGD